MSFDPQLTENMVYMVSNSMPVTNRNPPMQISSLDRSSELT